MFPTNNGMRRVKSAFAALARFTAGHRLGASLTIVTLLLAGSIVPLVGQSSRERGEGKYEHDSAEQIRKRSEWFFHQRAFPLGHIPAGARMKAFQQMEQMRRTKGVFMNRFAAAASEWSIGQSITPNASTWTSIGPEPTASSFFGNVSGRVTALAVDPCDSSGNTIYAGAAQGGVWKSTNGGTNWTPLTDSQLSISSGSLAVDPVPGDCTGGHTGAIYYGTGEENFAFDSFYGAGVLISRDGGATWTKDNTFVNVTSGTPSVITPESATAAGPFIGAISVDPATSGASQVLLAAVQGISNQAHSGIWRSTDGGADWTLIPATSYSPALPAQFDFGTGVAFDPNDPTGNTAYAALGIPFCTGANNTCDQSGSPELDNGVYKSTDGGITWTLLSSLDTAVTNAGLAVSNYGRITIAVGPSSNNLPTGTELVVSIANIAPATSTNAGSSADLLGIFKSTNGGQTFSPVTTPAPFCNDQCFYDMAVAISPANANVIFLGGGPAATGKDANGNSVSPVCGQFLSDQGISTVIESADGGTSWTDVSCDNASGTFIHVDTHAFAFAPGGTIYTGNDGGVWSSANVISTSPGGQTWSNLNNSLSLTQFYPGNSIHPSNPEIGFAGAQDNGMQMFTGQLGWTDTNSCGDGGWTAIDPSTPSTVYTTCEAIGQLGTLLKNQEDGTGVQFGANWIALDTPAIDGDNTDFVPPLVLDPTTPQNVYFGTDRVWQSTNGGLSWTAISTTLPSLPSSSGATCGGGICVITTLAVAPNSSNTIYVGADTGQIFDSTNATGAVPTFNEIDQSNMPGRTVTQIAVGPTNSQIAFATFSGFSSCPASGSTPACDGLGHVFMTLNGGGAWTNIDGNLPDTPVNDIVIDPNDLTEQTLYVATDVGVFVTTTGGTSWSELATGLPHVECTSLKLNNTARVLRVGTHGRGDWDLQLPGLPASALTGISPTSTTAGAAGFTLTLNGVGLPSNPTVNFGSTALSSSGSGSQITVTVPAAAVAGSGVVPVSVVGAQNSLSFSVEGPVPTLSTISPTTATATGSITLTVTGTNFNPNSEVIWTPNSTGVNNGVSTALPQLPGGTSTSFSVTVPASLLTSSLARTIPLAPGAPKPRGPGAFWLLAAFCAAILGILMLAAVPHKRRLVFGTTLTTVLVLLLIGGCGGVGSSSNPPPLPPPPGNSVTVVVNAYNPAPGGGLSATAGKITVSQ